MLENYLVCKRNAFFFIELNEKLHFILKSEKIVTLQKCISDTTSHNE